MLQYQSWKANLCSPGNRSPVKFFRQNWQPLASIMTSRESLIEREALKDGDFQILEETVQHQRYLTLYNRKVAFPATGQKEVSHPEINCCSYLTICLCPIIASIWCPCYPWVVMLPLRVRTRKARECVWKSKSCRVSLAGNGAWVWCDWASTVTVPLYNCIPLHSFWHQGRSANLQSMSRL